MVSFTRRVPARTGGARAFASPAAPAASSTPASPSTSASVTAAPPPPSGPSTVSTGIGSLDDILALSPGSSLLLLAPDAHTAWSRLVARHVASAGLLGGVRVIVAAVDPGAWVKGMVWVDEKGEDKEEREAKAKEKENEEVDLNERANAEKRIAWRYDTLKFETTVGTTTLDASKTIPPAVHLRAGKEGRLTEIEFEGGDGGMACLGAIARALEDDDESSAVPRVAVEISPEHDFTSASLVRFLLAFRALLRTRGALGVVTLPPRLSSTSPDGDSSEWISTLSHCADAALTLAGFGTAPLAAAYAPAHGLLTVHAVPARGHVLAPALRHSTLLGVAGGSETNLGFRLKRRRWVVETVHLGIEGGSGERRTEPVTKIVPEVPVMPAGMPAEGVDSPLPPAPQEKKEQGKEKKPRAKVRFGEEVVVSVDSGKHEHSDSCGHAGAGKAPRVEIRHDRPDLYEF